MRRLLVLSVALLFSGLASASPYAITPEAGAWMILVQSYSGAGSAQLADDLASVLRKDYSLPAYVFNRGEEERTKERARVAELKKKHAEQAKAMGLGEDVPLPKIRTVKIEDSYAVLVGGWKDMDDARKALEKVRKLKQLPERFMHKGLVVPQSNGSGAREAIVGGYNPFLTAFVVHNPLTPTPVDPEKGKLQNLKEYNADESFSLLKCRKAYTLMVKPYQGAVTLASATAPKTDLIQKIGGAKPGQYLNATAQQAHALAEVLQKMKDGKGKPVIDTDVYVLHTEFGSYVCVGGFDKPDDPALKAYQTKLANLKLGPLESLTPNPAPMPVPKP
ncbi:MAG: hypothetical protein K1X57_06415 [Gemmataceae bacterium]|nr:hypothetical protein [Gemmataceae bacterium]